MNKMSLKKVLFVGGKNVGVGCFKYLVDSNLCKVVGVVTNNGSDVSSDRWYKSLAEEAFLRNIPVFSPKNINDNDFVNFVSFLAPDFIFVVYYDLILKKRIIGIPKYGCINVHMALAEEYRGCYPTTWALINGEEKTGVTIHYIDAGIDSGDIIAQSVVEISEQDTGESLYSKCTDSAVSLFKKSVSDILKCTAKSRKQKTSDKTRYYRREFPSFEVDLSKTEREIKNYIRALTFSPFDPPYIDIAGKKFVIVEESEVE